ncbi:MAG: P-II family nitrogen regulator [Elusimicrobiota bacterium]
MKMIRAVIRPEKEESVVEALSKAGFPAVTKMDITGRGRQRGIQVGSALYEELAKVQLLLVVDDAKAAEAVQVVLQAAQTGNFGDGKVFVTPVEEVYTIRTGKREDSIGVPAAR